MWLYFRWFLLAFRHLAVSRDLVLEHFVLRQKLAVFERGGRCWSRRTACGVARLRHTCVRRLRLSTRSAMPTAFRDTTALKPTGFIVHASRAVGDLFRAGSDLVRIGDCNHWDSSVSSTRSRFVITGSSSPLVMRSEISAIAALAVPVLPSRSSS